MRRLLVHVFGREVLDIALARIEPDADDDGPHAAAGDLYDTEPTDVGLGFAPPAVWRDEGDDDA